jgi:hypothetical protein
MSAKPLSLPCAGAVSFSFSFSPSFTFFFSLQAARCPGHPAFWQPEPQYHTDPQAAQFFSGTSSRPQPSHALFSSFSFSCFFVDSDMALN